MELKLLPPILLALAEQQLARCRSAPQSSDAVATQPDFALARVWLRDDDRSCPVCRGAAPDPETGAPLESERWRPARRNGRLVTRQRKLPSHFVGLVVEDCPCRQDWRAGPHRSVAGGRSVGQVSGVGRARTPRRIRRPAFDLPGGSAGCPWRISPRRTEPRVVGVAPGAVRCGSRRRGQCARVRGG